MDIGVFIPIGRNGWIVSTTSPQYNPSFELNKQTTLNAERYGFDFALSMIKLRGFGGQSGFWDRNSDSLPWWPAFPPARAAIRPLARCRPPASRRPTSPPWAVTLVW